MKAHRIPFEIQRFSPTIRRCFLAGGAAILAALMGFGIAISEAAEKPEYKRTVLFENEAVVVLEVRFAPGAVSPLHTHRYPGRVIYVISGGVLEITAEGGKPKSMQVVTGEASWRPKESHAIRNVGDTEVRAVEIEIKNGPFPDN